MLFVLSKPEDARGQQEMLLVLSAATDTQTKPTKKRNAKGKATATHEGAITGEVIILVIAALQPVLVKSVTAAVTTAVATESKQIMLDLRHDLGALHAMEADTKPLRAQVPDR